MPIEFACETCNKLLRVPDGTGGRSCECPACHSLLEIPDPQQVAVVHTQQAAAGSQLVRIPCPKCAHALECSRQLLGSKGQCKHCGYIFTIATEPAAAAEASSGWIFTCPTCQQLFEGKPEMRGRKGKCHACGAVFTIELKRAAQPELRTLPRAASQPKPADAGRQASQPAQPAAPEAVVQIACSKCQGLMEVPASAAGQTTACPFCQQLLKIPAPKTKPASRAAKPPLPTARPETPAPDLWTDLGDLSSAAPPNPYASPTARSPGGGQYAAPRKSSRRLPSGKSPSSYVIPGAFLIVFGVLALLMLVVSLIVRIPGMLEAAERMGEAELAGFLVGTAVGSLLVVLLAVLEIIGGVAMVRQRGLTLARTAAIIGCLPCVCLVLNIPFGIWACVVCFSADASRDFR